MTGTVLFPTPRCPHLELLCLTFLTRDRVFPERCASPWSCPRFLSTPSSGSKSGSRGSTQLFESPAQTLDKLIAYFPPIFFQLRYNLHILNSEILVDNSTSFDKRLLTLCVCYHHQQSIEPLKVPVILYSQHPPPPQPCLWSLQFCFFWNIT